MANDSSFSERKRADSREFQEFLEEIVSGDEKPSKCGDLRCAWLRFAGQASRQGNMRSLLGTGGTLNHS